MGAVLRAGQALGHPALRPPIPGANIQVVPWEPCVTDAALPAVTIDGPRERTPMNLRKLLIIILVVFVVYFLITNPDGLANVVGDIGSWFADAFRAIIRFFTSLF